MAAVVYCYRRASFTTTADDETENVEVSNDKTAAVEPPAGITAEDFDRYIDSDVQTAAAITDEELCAGLQAHVSTAGDGESDGEPADTNDSQPDAAAVTLAVAL